METITPAPLCSLLYFVGKHKTAAGSVVVQQCVVITGSKVPPPQRHGESAVLLLNQPVSHRRTEQRGGAGTPAPSVCVWTLSCLKTRSKAASVCCVAVTFPISPGTPCFQETPHSSAVY